MGLSFFAYTIHYKKIVRSPQIDFVSIDTCELLYKMNGIYILKFKFTIYGTKYNLFKNLSTLRGKIILVWILHTYHIYFFHFKATVKIIDKWYIAACYTRRLVEFTFDRRTINCRGPIKVTCEAVYRYRCISRGSTQTIKIFCMEWKGTEVVQCGLRSLLLDPTRIIQIVLLF